MSIRYTEISKFSQDLVGLLRLGYSLEEAVIKTRNVQSSRFREILDAVVVSLQKGETFSEAFSGHEKTLPLFTKLIAAAEEGEQLESGLDQATHIFEGLAERRSRCFLATLYPVVVFSFGMVGLWLLFVFCGDLMNQLFGSMNLMLPLPTRIFMMLGALATSVPGAVIFFMPVVLAWLLVFGKTPAAGLLYRIPLFGSWLIRQESVAFLTALAQLHQSGTPLPEAASLARLVCPSPLQPRLTEVSTRMENGDSLSVALRSVKFVPEIGLEAIEHGEITENLKLEAVAELVDRQLKLAADTRGLMFEPIFFFLMFLAIGFVIISIFLPLYQLMGNLG